MKSVSILRRYELKYSPYGSHAILIEWPSKVDENMLWDILNFKGRIKNNYTKQKLQITNAYNSLLVIYKLTIDNFYNEVLVLKSLYSSCNVVTVPSQRLWKIPVCYEDEFALDLDYLSQKKGLSKSDIIAYHSAVSYTVFFIGFLPGFLYLGGLDKRLYFDRKEKPNSYIQKGSVGIGGEQTGVYPQESPRGWHIIGNSPIEFFNPKLQVPCFASVGDKIQFIPVSIKEHQEISEAITLGNYYLKSEEYHG